MHSYNHRENPQEVQTIGQIRENGKFLSNQRTELEKFYKTLRNDMGYTEIENVKDIVDDKEPDGVIMDNKKLNDMIKNAMNAKKG